MGGDMLETTVIWIVLVAAVLLLWKYALGLIVFAIGALLWTAVCVFGSVFHKFGLDQQLKPRKG